MVYKQDFKNVLAYEIERLEEGIKIISQEIFAREEMVKEFHTLGTRASEQMTQVDHCVNLKTIHYLIGEKTSKEDFLAKLKDKQEVDKTELNAEFDAMLSEYLMYTNISEDKFPDPHEVLRYNYMKDSFLLYLKLDNSDPIKKEASMFFYKGLQSVLQECGIKL